MSNLARRLPQNPILKPNDLLASNENLEIISLLNPGVFEFDDKTWLVVRVAEGVKQKQNTVSIPLLNDFGVVDILEIPLDDPELIAKDPRIINYKSSDYLTTLSHLRFLVSVDGLNFHESSHYPALVGNGPLEKFGLEDCRVTNISNTFYLTYTAVSENGVGVGLRTTNDFKSFNHVGMIFPPHNKDCVLFDQKINDKFYALHRPTSPQIGGNFIWIAESVDAIHWGNHQCILKTRLDNWDSERVGAGASPIKTDQGWLEIYHGANKEQVYCLGAFLMDINNPSKVVARTNQPIMFPTEDYELNGFFSSVIFTNGHTVAGDQITIYYGAADESVCVAYFSVKEILAALIYTS